MIMNGISILAGKIGRCVRWTKTFPKKTEALTFFFPCHMSLTGLRHIKSAEKQSPNLRKGDSNLEIFFFSCIHADGCLDWISCDCVALQLISLVTQKITTPHRSQL